MKITIEQTDRNEFTVESGSRKAEGLTTDEALGLCAALILNKELPTLVMDSSEWTDEMRKQAFIKLGKLGYCMSGCSVTGGWVGLSSIMAYEDGTFDIFDLSTVEKLHKPDGTIQLTFDELIKFKI